MPDTPAPTDATAIGPLALVEYPHPALRRPARPLVRLDQAIRDAVASMFEIMYEAQGIGLAANQVALPYRMFVINSAGQRGEGEEHVFINPVLSRPRGTAVQEEGCLSLPGEPIKADLDGLLARVVQHEFDHLEGRLFTDRLPEAAALEVRGQLEGLAEIFTGKQSRGELPPDAELLADLDRLEAARCQA
jgi:peptide deformylase